MAQPAPLQIDEAEVEISAIRAQGAGGQNVNKVSSAIHLRFDIPASSLPQDGVLVIKARRATQPTYSSCQRPLEGKSQRSEAKPLGACATDQSLH